MTCRNLLQEQPRPGHRDGQERFPHGPRKLGDHDLPILDRPTLTSSTSQRKRRSVVVSDRKVRSADVGVSGLYEVISEVDLAFTPDTRAEAVTVFQGRIREEVVYGICLPVPGFSVLFVLVAVSAVVSALVAGSLLYRYQLQREAQQLARQRAQQQQQQQQQPSSLFSGKAGVPSPDTGGATSPRPSAATTPVTMFGDTLLHHRAGKQVGSSLHSSLHLLQVSLQPNYYQLCLICKSAFCSTFYHLTFESREKVIHVSINIMI